jgi:putative membrane protein
MRMIATLAVAALIGFAAPAYSQQMSADQFVAMAASSDQFEIQSSEFVLEKGEAEDVKAFAEMMVADHSSASQQLLEAAQAAGVEAPAQMSEKHIAQLQELSALEGGELDEAYVAAQVAAHEEALALMEGYAEAGDQEALRAHAAATAPVIARHLEHVQQISAR